MFEFLKTLIRFFDENNISYMLSGIVTMGTYIVPRFTKDLDFIVNLKSEAVPLLVSHFKQGYYCDEDSIKDAIRLQSMFNIIDIRAIIKLI